MFHSHRHSSDRQITTRYFMAVACHRVVAVAADIGVYIRRMSEHHRQRRALARLDHRLLNDIGLSAETAQEELRQPFWR